jgi:hypothetical protein
VGSDERRVGGKWWQEYLHHYGVIALSFLLSHTFTELSLLNFEFRPQLQNTQYARSDTSPRQ